ncbi:MAG TPA: hypothetical protein VEZ20_03205 [Allosphingosinicella sp.]|nr:hypothetical protein [Allosphingosinicella sp.]
MKHPLRLLIHVPLREKRDFRQMLVGFKHALCVSEVGEVMSYDLLPSFKPRKGQEHRLISHLAEQLEQGWTLAVWDVERLLRELERIVADVGIDRPVVKAAVDEAWRAISAADEEQIVDLKAFEKLPNGHFIAMVAFREDFDYDSLPPRRRRRLIAYSRPSRPVCEDFWGVLHYFLMKRSDAARARSAYERWVKCNRPRPPRGDVI